MREPRSRHGILIRREHGAWVVRADFGRCDYDGLVYASEYVARMNRKNNWALSV